LNRFELDIKPLIHDRDLLGDTALDIHKRYMLSKKEHGEVQYWFDGHSEEDVMLEYILEEAMGLIDNDLELDEDEMSWPSDFDDEDSDD